MGKVHFIAENLVANILEYTMIMKINALKFTYLPLTLRLGGAPVGNPSFVQVELS